MYWAGLLLCVLLGGEIGAIVAGILAAEVGVSVPLIVVGANLVPWTAIAGIALLLGGTRRRAEAGAEPPHYEPAMAKIESSRATGEGPDIPLSLDLTVAPTGGRAYRVHATVVVNLMDLDDFRAGRTVVVDHDPACPWDVRVRRHPGAEFAGRLALARIDTAPSESRQSAPPLSPAARGHRAAVTRAGLLAVVAGVLLSLLPFHRFY